MPDSHERWLDLLGRVADEADRIALRHFRSSSLETKRKADDSPVSEADRAIEEAARAIAGREEPALGFLGEESGEKGSAAAVRLVCDPIDGTENFIRGIPIFATLLGIEVEGEVVAGLVSAPAIGYRWHAVRGAGAFCGGRRLRTSRIGTIAEAVVFHGGLGTGDGRTRPKGLERLISGARRSRGFGDFYQHLLVAEGSGEIAVDPVVKPWDVAPLLLIIEEAGGRATTLEGERTIYGGSLVTSNGLLHAQALDILRGC